MVGIKGKWCGNEEEHHTHQHDGDDATRAEIADGEHEEAYKDP